MPLKKQLETILNRLPREKQQELLDFAEYLLSKSGRGIGGKAAKATDGSTWETDGIDYDDYDDAIR